MGELIILIFLSLCTISLAFLASFALIFPRKKQFHQNNENVSVIIPVRNEAKNLSSLVISLEKQAYTGAIEIIFIDDESSDESLPILENIQSTSTIPITVIPGQFSPSRHLTSKQQALDLGISHAHYNLIALTDADIILATRWLASLVARMQPDIDLVYGHTAIIHEGNLFTFLQSFLIFNISLLFYYSFFHIL